MECIHISPIFRAVRENRTLDLFRTKKAHYHCAMTASTYRESIASAGSRLFHRASRPNRNRTCNIFRVEETFYH